MHAYSQRYNKNLNFHIVEFLLLFEIRCFCETARLEKSSAKMGNWALLPKVGFLKRQKVLASLERAEGKMCTQFSRKKRII
jgi:hypothetical protein